MVGSCGRRTAATLTCLNSGRTLRPDNRGMDTYDSSMAPRFRALLLQRVARLAHLIDLEHRPAGDRYDGLHDVEDFKDLAANDSIAGIGDAQAAHAAAEMMQVRAALSRIADGSYGLCRDCGDPIDLRRLAAVPAATCCAACQEVHERLTPA